MTYTESSDFGLIVLCLSLLIGLIAIVVSYKGK